MTTVDVSAFVTPDTVNVTGTLGKHLGADWTLVGGMMVAVHLARYGRQPVRLTKDADIVVDARTVIGPPLLRRATSALIELGFEPQPHANESGETVCHRFLRDTVAVDLLAPEGLRDSDQALGTLPGARTIRHRVARKHCDDRQSCTSSPARRLPRCRCRACSGLWSSRHARSA